MNSIAEAPPWLTTYCGLPRAKTIQASSVNDNLDTQLEEKFDQTRSKEWATEWLATFPGAIEGQGGDKATVAAAAKLGDFGLTRPNAFELLVEWNKKCRPPWLLRELRTKIENGYKYRQNDFGTALPEVIFGNPNVSSECGRAASRIEIDVTQMPFDEIATNTEAALINANIQFYVRGPNLMRPVVETVESAVRGRKTRVARLTKVTSDSMMDHASRAICFKRHNAAKKESVNIHPPRQIMNALLSRDGDFKFSRIAGVISAPTMRHDGSVVDKQGYDATTGLYLCHVPSMPTIPDKPSRRDAETALALLLSLLDEFPFVGNVDLAVAVSMLMTPILRGAMTVAPLHVVVSPAPGSGKSFLADLSSAIANGDVCPAMPVAKNSEEDEKRLTAALISGQAIISLDNLNGRLEGDLLCQATERPICEVRPLGKSELIRIENRTTIFANGNNIEVSGDLVRRTFLCSLDAKVERPELRHFTKNPLSMILNNRGTYVAAVLTIAKAFLEAKCPSSLSMLASYDDWSRFVRSPLVWLGCSDPVGSMEKIRNEDPELLQLNAFVSAWSFAINLNTPLTTNELISKGHEAIALGEAIRVIACDVRGAADPKRLGIWLKRRQDRIVGQYKICGEPDPARNQKRWFLKTISDHRDSRDQRDFSNSAHEKSKESYHIGSPKGPVTSELPTSETMEQKKSFPIPPMFRGK